MTLSTSRATSCSFFHPSQLRSEWVNEEVEHWLATKDKSTIIPVVTAWAGHPDSSAEKLTQYDWAGTDVPEALRDIYPEPLAVDLRWARSDPDLTLANPQFQDSVAEIAAAIREETKDQLIGALVSMRTRARIITGTIGLALMILGVTAAVAGSGWWIARGAQQAAEEAAADAQAAVVQAEGDLVAARAATAQAEEGLVEAQAATAEAESVRDEALAEADAAVQAAADANAQREEAEAQLAVAEVDLAVAEESLEVAEADLATARSDLLTAQAALGVAEAQLVAVEGALVATEEELTTTQDRLTETQADLTVALEDLTTAQEDLDDAQEELAEVNEELVQAQSDLAAATAEAARQLAIGTVERLANDSLGTRDTNPDVAMLLAAESVLQAQQIPVAAVTLGVEPPTAAEDPQALFGVRRSSVTSVLSVFQEFEAGYVVRVLRGHGAPLRALEFESESVLYSLDVLGQGFAGIWRLAGRSSPSPWTLYSIAPLTALRLAFKTSAPFRSVSCSCGGSSPMRLP